MGRLSLARLVAVAFLIVACDEAVVEPEPVVIRPATVAELTGPWRPTPLGLDVAMRTRVEQACRRDVQMPLGSVAAVIDARGASVVTVRMTGENPGSCTPCRSWPMDRWLAQALAGARRIGNGADAGPVGAGPIENAGRLPAGSERRRLVRHRHERARAFVWLLSNR